MIGLSDEQRRQAYLENRIRREHRMERVLARRLNKEFQHTGTESAAIYAQQLSLDFAGVKLQHIERLGKIIRPYLWTVFDTFGRDAFEQLADYLNLTDWPSMGTEEIFQANSQAYVLSIGSQKVTQVAGTTVKHIQNAISSGLAENLGTMDIARKIEASAGGKIGRRRAVTIAQTEVHSASNAAHEQVMIASNYRYTKEWLATSDAHTRSAHANADGQVVDQHDKFDVGGEMLKYPGDPDGSAWNIINCRCTQIFEVE